MKANIKSAHEKKGLMKIFHSQVTFNFRLFVAVRDNLMGSIQQWADSQTIIIIKYAGNNFPVVSTNHKFKARK